MDVLPVQVKKIIASSLIIIFYKATILSAHPWGGLVIDRDGNIFFTFISPMTSEQHFACVWQINDELELVKALEAKASPSDIILSRTPERIIYGAERSNSGADFQAQLWKINDTGTELIIPPTTDRDLFYIQAFAGTDLGIIYFAKDERLFQRSTDGKVSPVAENHQFNRIDDLAWSPKA
ncbi:MAG: hypothetical protein HKN76_19190, partial [Saprospiraceae bacterium]|nr:hypothetical protein [Saprospiraceae bacterium]